VKSASFEYVVATSLDNACDLLADRTIDSRLIAGGQTLVPLMNMRLARPERVIDIARLDELSSISVDEHGVTIGACVRQRTAERSPEIKSGVPLLAKALPNIGHLQTRNRGTVGGSLCNADPTAEISLVAMTLDAVTVVKSARGEREIAINEFLVDAMETSIAEDECLVSLRFPHWTGAQTGCGFEEVNARASDYAIVAAAAQIAMVDDKCTRINASIGGASPAAMRATATEQTLLGTTLGDGDIDSAASLISQSVDPLDDVHASASYRKRVAAKMLARVIRQARDECMGAS